MNETIMKELVTQIERLSENVLGERKARLMLQDRLEKLEQAKQGKGSLSPSLKVENLTESERETALTLRLRQASLEDVIETVAAQQGVDTSDKELWRDWALGDKVSLRRVINA